MLKEIGASNSTLEVEEKKLSSEEENLKKSRIDESIPIGRGCDEECPFSDDGY